MWLAIRFSCVEIYPKEAFGWLLGESNRDTWTIHTVAVPQIIEQRGKDLVVSHDNSDHTWRHFKDSEDLLIGDFHSHPDGLSIASKADKENMTEMYDGYCFLVIATYPNRLKKMSFKPRGYVHLDGKIRAAKVVKP